MTRLVSSAGTSGTGEVAVRLSVPLKRLRARLREDAGITRAGLTISQLALLQRLSEL